MSDNDLTLFIDAVAHSAETLAPQFQLHAAHRAIANNHDTTLEQLLQRTDLTDDTDTLIGTVTTANVRAAWCCRPERSETELLTALAKEKRVTVLARVAQQPGLSDAVYRHVLSRTSNTTVMQGLCCNDTAPTDVRVPATTAFLTDNTTDELSDDVWASLGTTEATASAAIQSRPTLSTLWYLLKRSSTPVHLDDRAAQTAKTLIIDALSDYDVLTQTGAASLLNTLRNLNEIFDGRSRPLCGGVPLWADNPGPVLDQLEHVNARIAEAGGIDSERLFFPLNELVARLRPEPTPDVPAVDPGGLIAAATAADTDSGIQAVLTEAGERCTGPAPFSDVVVAGLSNPAASIATIRAYADKFSNRGPRDSYRQRAAIAAAHNYNPAVGVALLSGFTSHYLTRAVDDEDLLERLSPDDPQALWRALFTDRLPDPDAPITWGAYHTVLDLLFDFDEADAAAVADLPWSLLSGLRTDLTNFTDLYERYQQQVAQLILALLTAELGDDPDMLENFMTFGATHQGTIGELIEIAKIHSEMSNVRRT